MNRTTTILLFTGLLAAAPDRAVAQSGGFELGAQVSSAVWSELEETDVGVGGRFAWNPSGIIGLEAEFNVYPEEFVFSSSRLEGLFGVTVGPRFEGIRPFAKLRSGFVSLGDAPRPFACVLIYPPPLSCELASGPTLATFDLGGGVEMSLTPSTFLRIEAGDRLTKYPGPVIDRDRVVHDDSFFGHDFRFAVGAGFRFSR